MATYTVEDIELIRQKSGISYQEAVSLLDYHNGNVARALVDLERNGRIRPEAAKTSSDPFEQKKKSSGIADLISKLYRARVKITKDSTPVINLSALFCIAAVIFSPHMIIAGAIASLVLGYRFSFTKDDAEFRGENLEKMVRSAAENVRSSVSDFARGFQSGAQEASGARTNTQSHTSADAGRSYYATPGAATYRADVRSPKAPTIEVPPVQAPARPTVQVPTINVPVQVESQDGSVTVEGDAEGFTSATID